MTKRKNRRREEFQKVIPSDKDHLSSVNVFFLAFLHVTIVTKLTETKINPCQNRALKFVALYVSLNLLWKVKLKLSKF